MANYRRPIIPADFQGDTMGSVVAHAINLGSTQVVVTVSPQHMHFTSNADLPADQLAHLGLEDDPSPPNQSQAAGGR